MNLTLRRQRGGQTTDRSTIWRQTETQHIGPAFEAATPDMSAREIVVDRRGVAMTSQTEQRRTASNLEARGDENIIQRAGSLSQRNARLVGPGMIAESGATEDERGPRTGPRAQRCSDSRDDRRPGNGKSQPYAGEAIEFSERAQHDHRQIGTQRDRARIRIDIGESFVDHEPAAALLHSASGLRQHILIDDAAIGIVGIDHNGVRRAFNCCFNRGNLDDVAAALSPRSGMLAISRSNDRDRAGRGQIGQPLDQRLGAGSRNNARIGGNAIGSPSGADQRLVISTGWQALPDRPRESFGHRPRIGIDPGRQVQPVLRHAAISRDCLAKITAVLHGRFMPPYRLRREGGPDRFAQSIRGFVNGLAALVVVGTVATSAHAAELPRIASINLCTDQLLLTLADPAQILGLSPYARDAARSWAAPQAARFPMLSGEAEDVLDLKPDLVLAGRFTKRATRELLKAQGLKVVEFDVARSIADAETQIRKMGDVVGHPDRAEAQVARIEAAVTRARAVVARKPVRVLAVARRGWVSGGDSLTTSLLATIGVSNAARDLNFKLGGFASLEAILSVKPDFLLLSEDSEFAEDQGRAFLLHPALEQMYPPSKRIVLPERLTVCGGPMLADALDRLVAEFERVQR
jgi:iron complex transport system substrate-binding protein